MKKLSPGNEGDSPKGRDVSVPFSLLTPGRCFLVQLWLQAKVTRWFETGKLRGSSE